MRRRGRPCRNLLCERFLKARIGFNALTVACIDGWIEMYQYRHESMQSDHDKCTLDWNS